jgi:DNA replication protein DnaC
MQELAINRKLEPIQRHCEKHGDYLAKRIQIYREVKEMPCPDCAQEKAFEEEKALAQRKKNEQIKNILDSCNIPVRYKSANIENLSAKHKNLIEYAKNFKENSKLGKSILMCGTPGKGKTFAAIAIGNYIIYNFQHSVYYVNIIDIFRRIKCSYKHDATENEITIIQSYLKPSLLIIDEIGIQYGTENEHIIMHDIINKRYEKQKSTILISNLTGKELKGFLGERIVRRVKEDNGIYVDFK